MKLSNVLTFISVTTFGALLYVHQQVELVKLSYAIETKEKALKVILDRKESLGYNINNLEAPSRLENVLVAKNIDIAFPKRGHVVKTPALHTRTKTKEMLKTAPPHKANIFGIFDFLSPRAEAQGVKD